MRKWLLIVAVLLAAVVVEGRQSNLLGDVRAERAKYGPAPTQAEAVAILNAVAFKHKDEGWGLSRKDGGTNCRSPLFSHPVACDILHHRPTNTLFDVLRDDAGHGGPGEAVWNSVGPPQSPDRTWTAPVQSQGNTVPPPPVCDQCPPDLSGDLARVTADRDRLSQELDQFRERSLTCEQSLTVARADLSKCLSRPVRCEAKLFGVIPVPCKVIQ